MNFKKITALTAAVCIVASCFTACSKAKIDYTDSAMYTENCNITAGMTEFCFNSKYIAFLKSCNGYFDTVGIDPAEPLSKQECTIDNSCATWYDYFMNAAKQQLKQGAVVYENAVKNNKTLTAEEKKKAAEVLDELENAAKESDISLKKYLSNNYGKNVTEEDVIRCSELDMLVQKYYSDYSKKVDTSDLALEEYLLNRKKTYCTVSYIFFSIPAEDITPGAMVTAKETADTMLKDTTPEKLIKDIGDYAENYYAKEGKKGKELKNKVTEIKAAAQITDAPYASNDFSVWAFDDNRALYDTMVTENSETNSCDFYMLTKLPERKNYRAVNMRQIQFDIGDYGDSANAEKKAKACLELLKENNFDDETFTDFAKLYSSDQATAKSGGKYTAVKKGELVKTPEIEKWLFDENRKEGDSAVMKTAEYGWHIVCFESYGEYVWKTEVAADKKAAAFKAYTEDLGDDTMLYENTNVIYAISETDQSKSFKTTEE